MADLGYWATVVALIASAYVAIASVVLGRRSNATLLESVRNGLVVAAVSTTVACAVLMYLLLVRDFGVVYVYEHVSTYLPTAYTVSAFWAGQEGSLLLWLWFAVLLSVVVVLNKEFRREPSAPYAIATLAFCQAFLALVLLATSNPFRVQSAVPLEGQGLNPLLQNVWMVIHPPVVFAGYAAYAVPFALAIGGLVSGRLGNNWLRMVRRWALIAWLFLGAGILMGAWWAYLELGWGGYWGWDPVENSSLIPWLTGTALLHSLIAQRRRRAFQTWSLWLMAATFLLCLFATFVTRSGIIQSVHAFGRSAIGYYFLAFMALCLVVFLALLGLRRPASGQALGIQSVLSREAGFLLTNLLLLGTALVVLVGTLFPTLSEGLAGRQVSLDPSFYEGTVGPLAQIVILLLGICPWLAWGGVSGRRLRRDLWAPAAVAVAVALVLLLAGKRQASPVIALSVCAFVAFSVLRIFYRDATALVRRASDSLWRALIRLLNRNHRRYGAHIVHLGLVLMAVGVTGSSVYQEDVQVTLSPGETVDVGGYTLQYVDLATRETVAKQEFAATVDVYRGRRQIATLISEKSFYWNVEQWVTEVAIHTNLLQDLYLILAGFEEDGLGAFRILINPLVVWLWIGGALLLGGGVIAWAPIRAEEGDR